MFTASVKFTSPIQLPTAAPLLLYFKQTDFFHINEKLLPTRRGKWDFTESALVKFWKHKSFQVSGRHQEIEIIPYAGLKASFFNASMEIIQWTSQQLT